MIDTLREQWALFVIALGAIYGGWAFYTRPALQELRVVQSELVVVTDERDELADFPAPLDPVTSGPTIESVLGIRFGDADLLGDQKLLNTIAADSGVQIVRIDPSGRSESTTFGPIVLHGGSLKLEATGAYSDVARFLSVLGSTPACVIEDVSLNAPGHGEMVELSLQLNTASVVRRHGAVADGDVE